MDCYWPELFVLNLRSEASLRSRCCRTQLQQWLRKRVSPSCVVTRYYVLPRGCVCQASEATVQLVQLGALSFSIKITAALSVRTRTGSPHIY